MRHYDYKQSKALHSSRSFLTSIAIELARIYEIPYRESKRHEDYITIGTIFHQKDRLRTLAGRRQVILKDYFSCDEWDVLVQMNDVVNPELHAKLQEGYIEGTKELILPVSINHFGPMYQIIAAKTNIVAEKFKLIIKSEGSVSGGSPTSSEKD
jgi:hypothetical protein